MSRIGFTPISIPESVIITQDGNKVMVKGPKGELSHKIPSVLKLNLEKASLTLKPKNQDKHTRALHGLTRSLIFNMVQGVQKGHTQKLELVGTGFRVAKEADKLVLSLGFSHPVAVPFKEGIEYTIEGNNKITIAGCDKQLVGQVAAEIRALKKPEPYKGKGIKYHDERVRRKPGKAAKVGAAGGGE